MSGQDRATDAELELEAEYGGGLPRKMAIELLALRRASQAAPEGCGRPCGYDCNGACFQPATAPYDGLREALEPFARLIEVSEWRQLPDDTSILGQGPDHDRRQVTAGDFKRALAAFSASPSQE